MHGLYTSAGPKRMDVTLWTVDVDAAFERLISVGAKPLSPPHDILGRLRGAWISDPDGCAIHLVAELPK